MAATESQDIILDVPKSNVLTGIIVGFCLPIGLAIPFFAGWQLPTLGISLFFIFAGAFSLILTWKRCHTPTLIINKEGIFTLDPLLHGQIKWEEIDALYCINAKRGGVFAVDVSPGGLIAIFSRSGKPLPRRMDITVPQLALGIPAANLPIPIDQLLSQIRERFSAQLEYYNIDLDDQREEEKVPQF